MAQKVASLYAEIGANTTGLQQGLAGAKKAITGTGTSFESLKTGIVKGAAAAGAAALILKGAFDQTAGAAVAYAAQVRDLNRVTGAGTEETSRLIQVADDMTISYGSLEQAAKMAAKNGIEFTTASLAALSDQYLALNPGQERAAFLLENFGKQGLEMGKLMEQGSAAIKGMSAAIDDSLVLTESAVQASRDFEIAQDNLSDSVYGVKVAVGNYLIPILTKATNTFLTIAGASGKFKDTLAQHEQVVRKTSGSYDEYITEMIRAGLVAKQFEGSEVNLAKAFLDGTLEIEKRPAVLHMLIGSIDALSAAQYANQGIIEANIGANQDWMTALDEGRSAVYAAAESYNALNLSDVTSMFGELTKELIFNKAAANLDATAALELASGMGLIEPKTKDAIMRISELTSKYDINRDGAIDATEAANGYTRETLAMAEAALIAGGRDPYETMSANSAAAWAAVNNIKKELDSIPANIPVTIDVTYNGQRPDQGWMDELDDYGPGGSSPAGNGAAQSVPGPGAGATYNVVINTAASANAVADRLKILEAYGA